jgi:exodeoxyribonuclease-5
VRTWLADLVANWLLFEAHHREGEWQVEELEKGVTRTWPPGRTDGLVLSFRPDRIDRVKGGLAVLDFKTGATERKTTEWAGARPRDPQLPLYAALLQDDGKPVAGLAFAGLNARDACNFVGFAATRQAKGWEPVSSRQKAFSVDFDETLSIMRGSVEALAMAYLDGDVRVDPRKTTLCDGCGCRALCRVHERRLDDDDDGGEGGE